MKFKLIAYASDFVSFLIQEIGEGNAAVKQIILFGSVARGESTKDSDIDLFIDVKDEKIEKKVLKIRYEFFSSVKVKHYWSALGIRNDIHCTVGRLDEWPDLKQSILANGIVLYGQFLGEHKGAPFSLFVVTPGKDRNKNLSAWRILYGYSQKAGKKTYKTAGLIEKAFGYKIARGVFMLPTAGSPQITDFLKKHKFRYQTTLIWR